MTAEKIYPLLCKPVLKEKIWGGRKLETLFGLELPEGQNIGEAWMVADLAEGASTITNGTLAGKPLSEAVKVWGFKHMIGKAWAKKPTGERYPLLIKFLDAQDDLSVQVHPDHRACQTDFPEDHSKDESWIIVQADPGGSILHGFEPGTTINTFNQLLEKGDVTECMRCVEVDAGQVYRVAPGIVHALCKGVAILEIQEPSDSTFRIYDYGRLDDQGNPRDLHLDAARKVMHFATEAPPEVQPRSKSEKWGMHDLLIDVEAYRIERLRLHGQPLKWKVNPKSTQSLIVVEGAIDMTGGGETLSLKPGSTVVLPAALGSVEVMPQSANATCILAGAGGIKMVDDE